MQGRLKSITLHSSQEAWKLDLPEITAAATPTERRQSDAPPHRIPISASHITSCATGQPQKKQKRGASSSEHILDNDDDDFMPPTKQHAFERASSSVPRTNIHRTIGGSTSSKLPFVRCMPSIFTKLTDHLNMRQRMKISQLGFGGLLQFCAAGLESSGLLVYLMDKLNPESMILEVGNEGGLRINEFCVKNVLGLPDGDRNPPSSTEEENELALVEFRNSVHADQNKELKCNHLLELLRKINIDNALAVRIFFVVAFNKLLFPALDNNIRGQDAFWTKDLSEFGNINWCKAVVHELRHAAITWQSDKKKSIPGCGIFLIIFYLDNLDSRSSIAHITTPRAKYFHKVLMEKIVLEDKRRDRFGNLTYGNLQLRAIAHTCYLRTEPDPNGISTTGISSTFPIFPRAEELGSLINEISTSSSRNKATDGLQQLAAKASQAIHLIQSGSNMLLDAHKVFIDNMRSFLERDPVEKTASEQDQLQNCPSKDNNINCNEEYSFSHHGCIPLYHQYNLEEYRLYNSVNQLKKLPYDLEEYRPHI